MDFDLDDNDDAQSADEAEYVAPEVGDPNAWWFERQAWCAEGEYYEMDWDECLPVDVWGENWWLDQATGDWWY